MSDAVNDRPTSEPGPANSGSKSGGTSQRPSGQPTSPDRAVQAGAKQLSGAMDKKISQAATSRATSKVAGKAVTGAKAVTPPQAAATQKVVSAAAGKLLRRTEGDQGTASGAAKDAITNVAASAAAGATTGGAVGAGLGAVKGLADTAVSNKKFRSLIIALLCAVLLLPATLNVGLGVAAVTGISALAGATGEKALSAVSASGVSDDEAALAQEFTSTLEVDADWGIILAASQVSDPVRPEPDAAADSTSAETDASSGEAGVNWDLQAFTQHLSEHDPESEYRDITSGAVLDGEGVHQALAIIPENQGGDTDSWNTHIQARELYVGALTASGFTEPQAGEVFDQALSWRLGVTDQCAVSSVGASSGGTGAGSNAPAGTAAGSLNADQIANGRSIIGMAKGMFGDDWEQAAVIGVMTALQESRLQVYANDGVMGNRPGEADRGAEYPKSAYDAVAKSMSLPHQAVGSDYVSLGLFQQQLVGAWGNLGEQTFTTDPDGQMRRLMDPAFSAFAFFRKLEQKTGWQDMDPVHASHLVQVSANEEAPRKHLETAKQFVSEQSSAPKIDPPEGSQWSGSSTSQTNCTGTDSGFGEVIGGFAHPIGDSKGWSTYPGEGQHASGSTDWIRPAGTPVFALAAGKVVGVSYDPEVLWCVSIEHTPNLGSAYCHIAEPAVKRGDEVKAGQKLSVIAPATTRIQVDHLHFTITKNPRDFWDLSSFFKTAKFLKDRGIDPGPCYRPDDPCSLAM